MKFQYKSGSKEPPQTVMVFGHQFTRNGDPVDVVDPLIIAKLSGNKCFAVVAEEAAELPEVEEEEVLAESPNESEVLPLNAAPEVVAEDAPPPVPVTVTYAKPRKPYRGLR